MDNELLGKVITFYSYKGGTGRTMALANVACVLAERADLKSKGVLMIDWDLEAPGLHRFFHGKLRKRYDVNPSKNDYESDPGLIELFYKFRKDIERQHPTTSEKNDQPLTEIESIDIIQNINLEKYIIPTTIDKLSFLKAGSFSPKKTDDYSDLVNAFDWEELYNKSPHILRVFAETLAQDYDYILIDSRTGVTDTSGICTTILPEKLVVVFTPNTQSLEGAIEMVREATEYRKESGDMRDLVVFPLVSRVEMTEPNLRYNWRYGSSDTGIKGYQPAFQNLLSEIYQPEGVSLENYFDEMQIQHIPQFAYGEQVAVLDEKGDDVFSIKRRYKQFASKLLEDSNPWEDGGEGIARSRSAKLMFLKRAFDVFDTYFFDSRNGHIPRYHAITLLLTIVLAIVGATASYVFYLKSSKLDLNLTAERQENLRLADQYQKAQNRDVVEQQETQITELKNLLDQANNEKDMLSNDFVKAQGEINKQLNDLRKQAVESGRQATNCQRSLSDAVTRLQQCTPATATPQTSPSGP